MAQARTEFAASLNQMASEKGIDPEVVLDAIRQGVLAAYKKDLTLKDQSLPDDIDDFVASVDEITGSISIKHGDVDVTPPGFARIAASIAKQVIMQRLYEAEKGAILTEYETKIGTVISGAIQRQEGNTYFIDLGRAEGVLPPQEQVKTEIYTAHQRLKFYIKEIREGRSGPEVVLSRSDAELVKGLFALEVPEIQSGSVTIRAIAREAGGRTKVAAQSSQDGVDAVGSLVGQKGVRVQAVMQELVEEKIDIIAFSEDPGRFIAAALSPAKNVEVHLDEENQVAKVKIPESQLSLAIGKGGQNVRLAAKLTGWKIDIEGMEEPELMAEVEEAIEAKNNPVTEELPAPIESEPAETPEEGEEKAETEAVNPEETPAQAVVEAVEENITEAEQKESVGGELEEEPVVADPVAAADAEADIAEEDEKAA